MVGTWWVSGARSMGATHAAVKQPSWQTDVDEERRREDERAQDAALGAKRAQSGYVPERNGEGELGEPAECSTLEGQ